MHIKTIAMALLISLGCISPAFAADHKVDWAAHCKAEMEKFKCDANGDDDTIYQCLLRHDVDLSKDCDNSAHTPYEKLTGKAQ